MKRKTAPRLAAAFVVTVTAGCGETPPQPPENPPYPEAQIVQNPDGTCSRTMFGNPPYVEPVPCPPGMGSTGSGYATPPEPTTSPTLTVATAPRNLPAAPPGWQVSPNSDGSCTAYGPDPCQHQGCNPPPPMRVACPPGTKPHQPD